MTQDPGHRAAAVLAAGTWWLPVRHRSQTGPGWGGQTDAHGAGTCHRAQQPQRAGGQGHWECIDGRWLCVQLWKPLAWRSRASRSDGNRRAEGTGEQRQTAGLHHRAVVTAQPPPATSSTGTGSLPCSFPTPSPSARGVSWKRHRRASQQGWGWQQASQALVFKDVLMG